MDTKPASNVHTLRPAHNGLFGQTHRARLEDAVKTHTDKPVETVNAVEQMLCVFFVEVARRTAVALGKKLAQVLSGK